MDQKQAYRERSMVDYGYIQYYHKAMENSPDSELEIQLSRAILSGEARRDYYTTSLRQINHLIQIGTPNLELQEPRWEIYKVSVSVSLPGMLESCLIFDLLYPLILIPLRSYTQGYTKIECSTQDISKMKISKNRVFFQNAEGTINMGVVFNDPDLDDSDIYWYRILTCVIHDSLKENEGLISIDEKLGIYSCYVELHRNGYP